MLKSCRCSVAGRHVFAGTLVGVAACCVQRASPRTWCPCGPTDRGVRARMNAGGYAVWDRSVRIFHWLNFVCVLFLSFVGTAINYTRELGVSLPGNLLLKTIHVAVGYVFVLNLSWRLVWGFAGGHYARWRQVLPMGRGFLAELAGYVRSVARRNEPPYLGHNPFGRLSVTAMLLVLVLLGISGLVLAGTDVYMPPFGHAIAKRIAAPGLGPSEVKPHVPEAMSAQEHADMMATVDREASVRVGKGLRRPVAIVHEWSYDVL